MSNAVDLKNLAQDMATAYEERTKRIAELKKETGELLQEFDQAHAELARGEGERKQACQAEAKQMAAEVREMLKEFDQAHAEMSAKLKSELAKSEEERRETSQAEAAERVQEVGELLQGFDKVHSEMSAKLKSELAKSEEERGKISIAEAQQRKSEVRELLEGFRKDMAQTAAAWRALLGTMQSERRGAVAASPSRSSLENRILDMIREHPQGIKLTAVAEALGEARIKLGNITRMLIDESKIRKEGSLYFLR